MGEEWSVASHNPAKRDNAMGDLERLASPTPEERYTDLVETLLKTADVSLGAAALKVSDKIFAFPAWGRLVVKLPRQRVDELVASGAGERFDPRPGRLLKEWFVLGPTADHEWLLLAREALACVAAESS